MSDEKPRQLHARILTDEEISSIHQSSLTTLQEVGILIQHHKALSLLAEAGAAVDPVSHHVKIPAKLVEKALQSVPSEFHSTPPCARSG